MFHFPLVLSTDQTHPQPAAKSLSKATREVIQPPGAHSWTETGGGLRVVGSGEDFVQSLSHFAVTSYRKLTNNSHLTLTIRGGQDLFLKPSQLDCGLRKTFQLSIFHTILNPTTAWL